MIIIPLVPDQIIAQMTQDHLNPPRPKVIYIMFYVLLHYTHCWKLSTHRTTLGLAAYSLADTGWDLWVQQPASRWTWKYADASSSPMCLLV